MPHMSLKPGHIEHFNALYAPHVPLPRTHGELQRPICPTCPSNPDTWSTSTAYMPHMSLKPGHMVHFNALYAPHVLQSGHMTRLKGGANIQRRDERRSGSERQRRRRRQTKADKQRNAMKPRPVPGIGPKRAQPSIKQRPVPEIQRNRARDVRCVKDVRYVKDVKN